MEKRWGAPVVLDNDANCAVLAEWTYGAARGADSAIVVTMGTGIGGGILMGGRLVRGANGMAGEFGHMKVVPNGQPCECGGQGCWEQYSSGNALVRFARQAMGEQPSVLEDTCGGNPDNLTGPMVTGAAEEGDLVARQAFASVGEWLGVGGGQPRRGLRPGGCRDRRWGVAGGRPTPRARAQRAATLLGRSGTPRRTTHRVRAAGPRGRAGRRGRDGRASGRSVPAVARDELERELLEEEPDVGDDALGSGSTRGRRAW
ncbi:ROK family protein [Nocardioides sp. B-3]|uniref:ROK family protein n=1 Tax=Nocardioides sp. B-3 TaxID=2895565 RepID=UPI003FA5B5B3